MARVLFLRWIDTPDKRARKSIYEDRDHRDWVECKAPDPFKADEGNRGSDSNDDFPQTYNRQAPCIIQGMSIPDRIIAEGELRRNNGERGTRKFVAYHGVVYDVTDCPKWRTDLHEQLHFAGQDLTGELPEAPHAADVFARPCVKVVGRLQ